MGFGAIPAAHRSMHGSEPKLRMRKKLMCINFTGRDMQKEQQGFTLIELMMVVAIIGTLAALAIPAYQDYTIRAQISEGLTLAAGAQTAVTEYYMERGAWPADNTTAGLADKHDIIGNYTEHTSVADNVIEVKYGYDDQRHRFGVGPHAGHLVGP